MAANHIEERVTIITDGERIEGTLYHVGGIRLSDFLNATSQQDSPFVKLKDSRVFDRRTGDELERAEFLMVARHRIVLVMTHEPRSI
jgi:hypothetical protein